MQCKGSVNFLRDLRKITTFSHDTVLGFTLIAVISIMQFKKILNINEQQLNPCSLKAPKVKAKEEQQRPHAIQIFTGFPSSVL